MGTISITGVVFRFCTFLASDSTPHRSHSSTASSWRAINADLESLRAEDDSAVGPLACSPFTPFTTMRPAPLMATALGPCAQTQLRAKQSRRRAPSRAQLAPKNRGEERRPIISVERDERDKGTQAEHEGAAHQLSLRVAGHAAKRRQPLRVAEGMREQRPDQLA